MMKIREMEFKDIEQVEEIEIACFPAPWSSDAFEKELTDNALAHYLVIEVEGRVVAYGGFWLIVDEAHITNIACHPDYQGKGYGEAITQALMDLSGELSLHRITLEVRMGNVRAQNLYRKLGFLDVGVRPNYYSDNREDALIMWKDIEV